MSTGHRSGPLRVGLVGTRGVPARYGGFETCVEEVGRRLADRGHHVVVYCRSSPNSVRLDEYLGMSLVHLPALRKRSLETLSHTALSVGHLVAHRTDAAVVFNSANAPWLPVLRAARIPVATHVDGLEWQRAKWGRFGRRYYQAAESLAVRWSDALIADAVGIRDYYTKKFAAETNLIAYGAPTIDQGRVDKIFELGLRPGGYHVVVARFEPENHVDMIVEGYVKSSSQLPLIVVGSAPYADEYTKKIRALADERVRLLGGVWDQDLLDQLYANALTYLHGHSVGGTNPSLLRALGAGTATTAFDVVFNREVLGDIGVYFSSAEQVSHRIEESEADIAVTQLRAKNSLERAALYDWDGVTDKYEYLLRSLAGIRTRDRRSAAVTA